MPDPVNAGRPPHPVQHHLGAFMVGQIGVIACQSEARMPSMAVVDPGQNMIPLRIWARSAATQIGSTCTGPPLPSHHHGCSLLLPKVTPGWAGSFIVPFTTPCRSGRRPVARVQWLGKVMLGKEGIIVPDTPWPQSRPDWGEGGADIIGAKTVDGNQDRGDAL
jgi:hypothetical protein